jgi:hypothetical protein
LNAGKDVLEQTGGERRTVTLEVTHVQFLQARAAFRELADEVDVFDVSTAGDGKRREFGEELFCARSDGRLCVLDVLEP